MTHPVAVTGVRGARRASLTCLLVLVANVVPLSAQDRPSFDLSGGYSVVRELNTETFPRADVSLTYRGWTASASLYFSRLFGAEVEASGNYTRRELTGSSVGLGTYAFVAGPRLAVRVSDRATLFGHALVGAALLTAKFDGRTESETHGTLQLGGGIDWRLASRLGLRLAADYRRVFLVDSNDVRFYCGLVVTGGTR
jgi:opacity protein-like surface antigen